MFRTTILRAARLPRAAGVSSSSVLASVRPATLRIAGPSRASAAVRALDTPAFLSLSTISASRRYYSATAEATEAAEIAAEPTAEEETKLEPEEVTRFATLKQLGVHANIVDTITKNMGYETMTPVQAKTITPALAGKDMVAQARTGTGKTLAFLIPTIQRVINENPDLAYHNRVRARPDDIQAIILSPTRELAEQISEEARKLCRNTGVIVQTAVGGTKKREMLLQTKRQGCHLLIATPGRLHDLLSSPYSNIKAPKLSALVLDEADRMLDVGFEEELKTILEYLPDRKERPRQTLLFSATIPKNVIMIARSFVDPKNFEFVQTIAPDEAPTHEKVPQYIVPVRGYENLFPTMLELMKREVAKAEADTTGTRMPFKAIVFLQTTNFVQMTSTAFRHMARRDNEIPHIYHIHSKLTQAARTDAAEKFRRARSGILFSSDVTARGMDFPNVTHVIQIGVPSDREYYIHRLGRTGRAEKGGEGWVILPRYELDRAREVLVDLPIKRASGLESADYNMSVQDETAAPPAPVADVSRAMKLVPTGLLNDTYMAFFGGGSMGRKITQQFVDGMNDWVTYGWGWESPPPMTMETVRKRGLSRFRGIHIGERPHVRRSASAGIDDFQEDLQSNNDDFERSLGGNREGTFARRSSSGQFRSRPDHRSDGGGGRGFDRGGGGRGFDRGGGGDRGYNSRRGSGRGGSRGGGGFGDRKQGYRQTEGPRASF